MSRVPPVFRVPPVSHVSRPPVSPVARWFSGIHPEPAYILTMTRARISALIGGTILALAAATSHLHAQVLTGTVTSAEAGTPVSSAIVVLLDAQRIERGRTPLSADGRFSVTVQAGEYRVRVLRVGFAPFDAGTVTVPAKGATVALRWVSTPVTLPQVITRERQSCDLTRVQSATLALVWEQISAALGVTDAAVTAPRQFERYSFLRRLDPDGRFVRGITQQRTRGASLTSYQAWDPESLAVHGYLREEASGNTYYGPTAHTLVSPAFLRSHCFALIDRPDGNRDRLVVRFQPASARERVVDIAGSFWVDRHTARLDSVQFHYTGLPAFVAPEQARGSVHFAQQSDGNWFVSQWTLRMPHIGDRARRSSDNLRRTTFALEERAVTELQEEGGVVLAVDANRVAYYRAGLPALRLQFDQRPAWLLLAQVRVKGTDISAPIDSAGHSTLAVPEGRYDLTLHWPFSTAAGDTAAWRLASGIATRSNMATDRVRTPTDDALLKHLCGNEPQRLGRAGIWGMVTDSLGKPLPGATVAARWVTAARLPAAGQGDRLSATTQEARTVAGGDGRFLVCGVPRAQFVVEASAGDPTSPWSGRVSVYLSDRNRFEPAGIIVAKPLSSGK